MPAGSFNVTNICRPINWAAMMNYGSVPRQSVSIDGPNKRMA